MSKKDKKERYLPHGAMQKIADELNGKPTYTTVKAFFRGSKVSIETIEAIETVAEKYYRIRTKADDAN